MDDYWQIAAGYWGRDYSDYFIKHGIAFVGGEKEIAAVKQVKEDDIVVLKRGKSAIIAAGRVVKRNSETGGEAGVDDKDKSWLNDFDGWPLPGYCYVDWHVPPKGWKGPEKDQTEQKKEVGKKEQRDNSGLTIGTIKKLYQPEPRKIADLIISSFPVAELHPEPKPVEDIEDHKILEHLVSKGMRVSSADDLTNAIKRIRLLADYYCNPENKFGGANVREHETRSFLVIPLLLALGWSEQQLKIEYPCGGGKVDIACFPKSFRGKNDECTLLIETKALSQGLDYAQEQIERYRQHFKPCHRTLITNGFCYSAYDIKGDQIHQEDDKPKPYAYLNLRKPKDKYPLDPDNVKGALEVLTWLLPTDHML